MAFRPKGRNTLKIYSFPSPTVDVELRLKLAFVFEREQRMSMSRANYARAQLELLAQRARSYVRNDLKRSKVIDKAQLEELTRYLVKISRDWRVTKRVRTDLEKSVWDEFKIDRQPAILKSTTDAGNRNKRLGLRF